MACANSDGSSACAAIIQGIKTLKQALAGMEPIAKADPDSLEMQSELAAIYQRLGAAEGAGGQKDAMEHLTKALSMVKLPPRI